MSEIPARLALPPLRRLLASQLAYHTRLLLRTPRAIVGGMLLPILLLLLRGGTGHLSAQDEAQLVAGLAVFGTLSTAYITHTASLVAARQAGVLKRWRITPLPGWSYLTGRISATAIVAVTGGLITVVVGCAEIHTTVAPETIAALIAVLTLGAAACASIGTAVSAVIPAVEAAWPLLGLTYLPVVILSGSFGTVGGEPRWLSTAIDYLPVRPVVDSVVGLLRAGPAGPPVTARDIAVLVAWGAAGLLLSSRVFRWTPR